MNELFEKFKHHGLIFGNKVNKRKIGDLKFAKLLDLTDEIGSLLTKPNIKSSNNIFVHTAYHMVNAVINDVELEPMVATFEDGYKAVVICDAILKSSKSGKKEKVVY